jgi:hypothetical protein
MTPRVIGGTNETEEIGYLPKPKEMGHQGAAILLLSESDLPIQVLLWMATVSAVSIAAQWMGD